MTLVFVLVLGLVAATSFLSGVFGVAGGLILMGGLLYLLPVSQAMLIHGLAQFVSNATRAVLWRRFIAFDVLARFASTSVLSLAVFAALRFVPSKTLVLFLLGFSTVALFFVPQRYAPKITHPLVAYFAGAASTALILLAGVSGPFLDQFFVRSGLDRRVTIATKSAMQCIAHVIKIVYFGVLAGRGLDAEWWGLAAIVPVASIVGSSLAAPILARMTDKQFYWWTRRLVFLLGLYYIVAALRAWMA